MLKQIQIFLLTVSQRLLAITTVLFCLQICFGTMILQPQQAVFSPAKKSQGQEGSQISLNSGQLVALIHLTSILNNYEDTWKPIKKNKDFFYRDIHWHQTLVFATVLFACLIGVLALLSLFVSFSPSIKKVYLRQSTIVLGVILTLIVYYRFHQYYQGISSINLQLISPFVFAFFDQMKDIFLLLGFICFWIYLLVLSFDYFKKKQRSMILSSMKNFLIRQQRILFLNVWLLAMLSLGILVLALGLFLPILKLQIAAGPNDYILPIALLLSAVFLSSYAKRKFSRSNHQLKKRKMPKKADRHWRFFTNKILLWLPNKSLRFLRFIKSITTIFTFLLFIALIIAIHWQIIAD